MTASHFAGPQRPGRRLLVSLASLTFLASGCSNFVSTAPSSGAVSSAAKVGGHVHGGNQPVAGATVNLYFAGQNGIANSAQLVATTTSADDGYGSFSFTKAPDGGTNTGTTNTFSCPGAPGSPFVYIVARGGNTLNTHNPAVNNPASVFLAPMGLCSDINASTFISMSEGVTVATVAAVHQYMNVNTGVIGSDGILTSYNGLANSFRLVSNMVDLSSGQTLPSVVHTGIPTTVSITATPEQAKLNQIANIISACVNTTSGASGQSGSNANACDTLFANAVPPTSSSTTSTPGVTFSPATDVLQATYYMFTNPTSTNQTNLTALYNLSPGSGAPYQPTLTAVPSDWSIGIRYQASGVCGTGTNQPIHNPYDLNIDGNGNVWVANDQPGGSSLFELSFNGTPVTCQPIGGASHGGTIDSGPGAPGSPGNVWVGDLENKIIYRYDSNGGSPLQFPVPVAPYALAADGVGNVYFSSINPGAVWKIAAAATTSLAVAPVQISTNVGAIPTRILVDGNGAIWASSRDAFVSLISPATSGAGLLNGYITTHVTTPTPSYGIAVTASLNGANGLYVSSQEGSSMLDEIIGSGVLYSTANGFPTASNAGGLNVPSAIAVDGAQNVWAANDGTDSGTNLGVVSQFASSGTPLSANGTVNGGYQKATASFANGRTIVIDQSGNVWVGNDGSFSVTEIVGGGVPVYQPYAIGLREGRFQTKP